jgi:hypothetical protein
MSDTQQDTISIEEFSAQARAFLEANAAPRPPVKEFVWGQGSDDVAMFDEMDRESESAQDERA